LSYIPDAAGSKPVRSYPDILFLFLVKLARIVGAATPYEMDGLGIEFGWRRDFSHPFRTRPGAHPAYCTIDIGSLSPGV
jgi:hypothetical protein